MKKKKLPTVKLSINTWQKRNGVWYTTGYANSEMVANKELNKVLNKIYTLENSNKTIKQ